VNLVIIPPMETGKTEVQRRDGTRPRSNGKTTAQPGKVTEIWAWIPPPNHACSPLSFGLLFLDRCRPDLLCQDWILNFWSTLCTRSLTMLVLQKRVVVS